MITRTYLKQNEIDSLVNVKLNWILSSCCPLKVILFGSAADGWVHTNSDIDLILIFPDKQSIKSARKDLYTSRPKDDWPHDLVFHTEETFQQSIAKGGGAAYTANLEGKIIYDSSKTD